MRKKIIVGNWKMNMTTMETKSFLEMLKVSISVQNAEVLICPSFTSIGAAVNVLQDTNISVGAQNISSEERGSYTGEVSIEMLKEIGVAHSIIGHSERRKFFFETDEIVNKKAKLALENGVIPIICVGEDIKERKSNKHIEFVESQIRKALADLNIMKIEDIIIAYEPVWAIGTGETATLDQIEEMCSYIRYFIAQIVGVSISEKIRILYGGSVNKENVTSIVNMNNIDGVLVGGASLKPEFVDMVKQVEK